MPLAKMEEMTEHSWGRMVGEVGAYRHAIGLLKQSAAEAFLGDREPEARRLREMIGKLTEPLLQAEADLQKHIDATLREKKR